MHLNSCEDNILECGSAACYVTKYYQRAKVLQQMFWIVINQNLVLDNVNNPRTRLVYVTSSIYK